MNDWIVAGVITLWAATIAFDVLLLGAWGFLFVPLGGLAWFFGRRL